MRWNWYRKRFFGFSAPHPVRRAGRRHSARWSCPRVEVLEDRHLLTILIAVNDASYLRFNSATPTQASASPPGPNVVPNPSFVVSDLAFRTATGQLYAAGQLLGGGAGTPIMSPPEIDTVDPTTGNRTLVVQLSGSALAFDPATDRLRVTTNNTLPPTSTTTGSILVNPVTGSVIEQDGAPAYVTGDPNFGKVPFLARTAYAANPGGPSTLYAIDANQGVLATWDAANRTLRTVGPLGAPFSPFGGVQGFTIDTAGGRNAAFAVLAPQNVPPQLYQVSLATGAATAVGPIDGTFVIQGLASGLPPQTVGAFDPGTATWYLRNSTSAGAPDAGTFQYGAPGWVGVAGDWNGDGVATVGAVNPATAIWYLRNENSAGAADAGTFPYGLPGWVPVAGDWTGTGHTGIGMFDPATATWYLRNNASAGAPDFTFQYGAPGWVPLAGRWTGGGKDTVGVVDPSTLTWYLRNENSAGAPDAGQFQYGAAGWKPVAGDWDGDGVSTPAVVDPAANWYVRNENSAGAPDLTFPYGVGTWTPLAGRWTSPTLRLLAASGTQTDQPDVAPLGAALLQGFGAARAGLGQAGLDPVLLNRLASLQSGANSGLLADAPAPGTRVTDALDQVFAPGAL
jgi:hypothetical protein